MPFVYSKRVSFKAYSICRKYRFILRNRNNSITVTVRNRVWPTEVKAIFETDIKYGVSFKITENHVLKFCITCDPVNQMKNNIEKII